jgi:NitT/TauT family transport system ATP-binding protein
MTPHIELRGVSHVFEAITVLDNISLSVQAGEILTIVGPSGCGKSTILNLIAGFLYPSAGHVVLDGRPISGPGPERGVCFQEHALFPWLSVWENVLFGPKAQGRCDASTRQRAGAILEHFGLAAFKTYRPAELSGGMRQRVAIARLLINDSKVLLMDEPFGALDAQTRLKMQEFLLNVQYEYKATTVFITHDVDEALYLGHHLLVMGTRPGRIVDVLHVDEPHPRTRDFLVSDDFRVLKSKILGHLMLDTNGPHHSEAAA